MHAVRNLVFFLPLMLLAACGTPSAPAKPASQSMPSGSAAPRDNDLPYGEISPDRKEIVLKPLMLMPPDGPLVHIYSGFSFPAKLGDFQRNLHGVQIYTSSGDDVSVDFNEPVARVHGTLYVYPTHGQTLSQEFDRRIQEVEQFYGDTKLVSSGNTTVTPKKLAARMARLTFTFQPRGGSGGIPVHSVLVVGQQDQWFVEYRLTYPAENEEQAAPAIAKLLRAFAWPEPEKGKKKSGERKSA